MAVLQREALLDEIMCDLVNGMSRFQIRRKLEEDQYESMETSNLKKTTHGTLITDCFKRFKLDSRDEVDEARDIMYARILSIYEDAVSAGDRQAALKALDQLTKLQGLLDPLAGIEKRPDQAKVTITFGISKDEENEEEEEQQEKKSK